MPATTIRATYRNGVLEPLERMNLREGEIVTLSVAGRDAERKRQEAIRACYGMWRELREADRLLSNLCDSHSAVVRLQ